jgi:hypothetical protein
MAIVWSEESENFIELVITGKLVFEDYLDMQKKLAAKAGKEGKCNMLVLLKDFEGWDTNKGWGDPSITEQADPHMNKLAIVGDEKWRDLAEVFTLKGLRPVPIEYFTPDKEQQARGWLSSAN